MIVLKQDMDNIKRLQIPEEAEAKFRFEFLLNYHPWYTSKERKSAIEYEGKGLLLRKAFEFVDRKVYRNMLIYLLMGLSEL